MKKRCKYKREHFKTQQEYELFKALKNDAQKRWLERSEVNNPEKRERRLLRQRLYARYYYCTDGRKKFSQWLLDSYGIVDIKDVPIAELRICAKKLKR